MKTKTLQYQTSALRGDYIRGGIGVAIAAGLLISAPVGSILWMFLSAMFLLFAGFVWRTWRKSQTVITLSDDGVVSTVGKGTGTEISWNDLRDVRVRAFSVRKSEPESGWLELTVWGREKVKITVESTIDDFDLFLTAAGTNALRNDLELSETTRENLAAVGVAGYVSSRPPEPRPEQPTGGL